MYKPLIKFVRHNADLKPTLEMWVKDSFAEREKAILEDFFRKNERFPSKKMNYIRKAILPINPTTSMGDLRLLSDKIKEQFNIECFQIVIKRSVQCSYFLFDFYDKELCESYWLNPMDQKYLLVLIVRTLKLDISLIPDKYLRYYFVSEYKDNPNVFYQNLELLKRKGLGKKMYSFVRNIFKYTELISSGILRGCPI